MFRMKEPGVDIRRCHKDYVEIMANKYDFIYSFVSVAGGA